MQTRQKQYKNRKKKRKTTEKCQEYRFLKIFKNY